MKTRIVIVSVIATFFVVPIFIREAKASTDITPPRVTSFSVSPEIVDTSAGPQDVTLTMTVEDDASDICMYVTGSMGSNCPGQLNVRFHSIGSGTLDFSEFQIVSGNMQNGVLQSTATLPQGSKLGPWMLEYIIIFDTLDNYSWYSAWRYNSNVQCGFSERCDILNYHDIPNISGTVIGNSGSTNSFYIDSQYEIINPLNGTKVTFPAGTTITREDGGIFELYRMVNQEGTITGLPTDGLAGNIAEILELGIPDMKLSFSQPVQVDLKVPYGLDRKTLTIKSLGGGDAAWVNEGTCKVDDDGCTFTVNHASHFAATTKKKVKETAAKVNFSAKKSVKKSWVKIKVKTNKSAILDIDLNGARYRTAVARRSGKYTLRINDLELGENTIVVMATKGATTATKTRTVTRR